MEIQAKSNSSLWKYATFMLLIIILVLAYKMYGPEVEMAPGEIPKEIQELNIVLSDDDPFMGSADAPITIVEFSDFQCPFCAKFQSETLNQIKERYVNTGKVKLVYRDFPLNSIHPDAQKAAEAAECADDQGKFWEYHDILFDNQVALKVSNLKSYAQQLGLDTATFNDCLDSGKHKEEVTKDLNDGSVYGISGTPGFLINGQVISGAQPFSSFENIIEEILTGKAPSQPTQAQPGPSVDTSNDPEIELFVINDESCEICVTDQLVDVLSSQLFPTAKVTELDYKTDARGREFVEELNIIALPAFVLSKNVNEAANFPNIEEALEEYTKYYVVTPAATDAPKYLIPINADDDPVKGNDNAPVTIIEFSDFQCPFCQKWYAETLPLLEETYIKNGLVKLVYRDFPLNIHPDAQKAAEAAECADDQGMYWEYHDKLFDNQRSLKITNLKSYAQQLGLNAAQFDDCLDSGKYTQEVLHDLEEGQTYGISGTPGFFVNGIKVSGAYPYEHFKQLIEDALVE